MSRKSGRKGTARRGPHSVRLISAAQPPNHRHDRILYPMNMKLSPCIALLLVVISGCAASNAQRVDFNHPLDVGSYLPADNIVIVCDTRAGARFMTRTGFYHAGCERVMTSSDMRVIEREYEDVGEGGMWLLRVRGRTNHTTWLVLPWHDWA